MIERVGSNNIDQSKVDWVIILAGQLAGQPDPKKPTGLRGFSWGSVLRKQ